MLGVVGTERQRKRKQERRRHQPRGTFQSGFRSLLDPNASTAVVLRRLWVERSALGLREEQRERILDGFPYLVYEDTGEPLIGVVDAPTAWPFLETIHDFFVGRIQELVAGRGSAEWLWWLRRLRGQFDDLNDMVSTGPYVQAVAEALAAGVSRPSNPLPDHSTFEFPITAEALLDLIWVREIAIMMYRLHATMKRCAKGQRVELVVGDIPRWEQDDVLDDAIEEYDTRGEKENANLLRAVGVVGNLTIKPDQRQLSIGGLVPYWYAVGVGRKAKFEKADPPPYLFSWIDLDAIAPFQEQAILTRAQIALVVLLWSAFNIGTRAPEHATRRMTTPIQWGYMVTPTESFLLPALDELCGWLKQASGRALDGCWRPESGAEVLTALLELEPEIWPPLCGCPVHEADRYSVIDLLGASHRLFSTLLRPAGGAPANAWSEHFEQDVQAVIDRSDWRPPDALRPLIGKPIRRRDGTDRTNIDALGFNDGRLLLVSCKSIAFTVPAVRGEFSVTRNIVEKIHAAAAEWDLFVTEAKDDHDTLRRVSLPPDVVVDGCVVFPSVPFYTEARWRRSAFDLFPYLLSVSELSALLGDPSFLEAAVEDARRSAAR